VAGAGCLFVFALAASAWSAELQPRTVHASDRYAGDAERAFLQRSFDGLELTRDETAGIRLVHASPDTPPSADRTFTRFVERDGGVHVELETLGLSRRFPPLLGWIIEPIARRLGRSSVERSLGELKSAVLHTR
jgi:hypothetical protein